MPAYAILIHPAHESISYEQARPLLLAEMEAMTAGLEIALTSVELREIAGNPYLTFQTEAPLFASHVRHLRRMSFVLSMFERAERDGWDWLRPLPVTGDPLFNNTLVTMHKYAGKTNPTFTRLLLNLALQAADCADREGLQILDPVAGKGTTLFEGLVAGHHVAGVEIVPEAVQDGIAFLRKYLELGKYKHRVEHHRISGPNRSFRAEQTIFSIGAPKGASTAAPSLSCEFVSGDAKHASALFRKERFHTILGDLPYGVRHGNVARQPARQSSRNPAQLVADCLPAWIPCLRPGGTVALAWNTFVLPREQMERLFEGAGLIVLGGAPYDNLEHRVDQAIKRDVMIGRKPGGM